MPNSIKEWKVFICHASEDKVEVVDQLAIELIKLGLNVWYDDESILIGHDINKEVFVEGLNKTRYAIIVFSKNFYKKRFPQYESGVVMSQILLNRHIVPIPFIFKIKKEIIKKKSPFFYNYKYLIVEDNTNIKYNASEINNCIMKHEKLFNDKNKKVELEMERLKFLTEEEKTRINQLTKRNTYRNSIIIGSLICTLIAIALLLYNVFNKDEINTTKNSQTNIPDTTKSNKTDTVLSLKINSEIHVGGNVGTVITNGSHITVNNGDNQDNKLKQTKQNK
ncbi:MAG: toll/interleukin-1 receptor domain-containing protein [Bacteroidetes bacterium]|nr:toll/interleukin-1 receptor domain-containing protein [Bacteroidota bacterium]